MLGEVYTAKGEHGQAVETLEHCLTLMPQRPYAGRLWERPHESDPSLLATDRLLCADDAVAYVPSSGWSDDNDEDSWARIVAWFDRHVPEVRRDREAAVLARLTPTLSVPEVLPNRNEREPRLAYVPGILGQEWVVARSGSEGPRRHVVLIEEGGRFLRQLHNLSTGNWVPAG